VKQVGEPQSFRPMALLRFVWRRRGTVGCGWRCRAGGVVLFAADIVSWAPVSVVIPASASNYIVGTFGAKYLLKEDVSFKRWLGVILVCAGVTVVLLTGRV